MSSEQHLNPWNYKPWWCQPWSIVLTGSVILFATWMITKTVWITILISLPILVWWTYFLWLWPKMLRLDNIHSNEQASFPDSEQAN